jgi:hypothetical protein
MCLPDPAAEPCIWTHLVCAPKQTLGYYGGVRRSLGLMDFSSNKFGEISSHTLLQNFPIGITHPICAPNCMTALA